MMTVLTVIILAAVSFAVNFRTSVPSQESGNSAPAARQIAGCPGCNVVVIVVDTLRADHLPMYGYQRNTAPFLASVFDKSVVFERAFSSSSWTAPATASIFTAVLPSKHGVITGFSATKTMIKRKQNIELNTIPRKMLTLGEMMRDAGYTTVGVADNLNIGKEIGFSRGFDYFRKYRYLGAEKVNQTAIDLLAKAGTEKPYFLYLHYMDPHEPYHKRKPWYKDCFSKTARKGLDKMICAYDSEISYLDQQISSLFEKYKWLENSVVFFTSDHGEEFLERGNTGHGKTLYTEMIHVPLAMYHPGLEPANITRNVNTYDLMPTLAGLIGAEQLDHWQGRNLNDYLAESDGRDRRVIKSERLRAAASGKDWWRRAVIKGEWHLVKTERADGSSESEIYNLTEDYKELNNLHDSKLSLVRELENELGEIVLENAVGSETTEIQLDQELHDQLRSLGYLN